MRVRIPMWGWVAGGLAAGAGAYILTRPSASPAHAVPPKPVTPSAPSKPLPVPPSVMLRNSSQRVMWSLRPAPPSTQPSLETSLAAYNLTRLNQFRAQHGAPALAEDGNLSVFARAGSVQLAQDHSPHAHFRAHVAGAPGFGNHAGENQGDADGVASLHNDPVRNGQLQIDRMLGQMMAEGPGGGHYDNIVDRTFRRVGFGLVTVAGKLFLTNDFSS